MASIYSINFDDAKIIYIGSTKLALELRLYHHLRNKKGTIRKYLNDNNLDEDKLSIHLLESCQDNAKQLEQEYITKHKNLINKRKAYETLDEKKLRLKQYAKHFYHNKGGKSYKKEYYLKNKNKNDINI